MPISRIKSYDRHYNKWSRLALLALSVVLEFAQAGR